MGNGRVPLGYLRVTVGYLWVPPGNVTALQRPASNSGIWGIWGSGVTALLKKTNISEPVKLAKNQANGSSDRQIKNKSNAKPTELPGNKLKTSKKPTDTDATDIKAIATLGTGDLSQPLQTDFSKQGAKLSETSRKELEKLAGTIINKKKTRVQLMAYARSENLSASRWWTIY